MATRGEWSDGSGHRRRTLRRELRRVVDAGDAWCPFCGGWIPPGAAFDVDHKVPRDAGGDPWDRGNLRPAHPSCNRRAGQRITTRKLRARAGSAPLSWRSCPGCSGPIPSTAAGWLCRRCAAVVAGG